jgi:hypothetical protein
MGNNDVIEHEISVNVRTLTIPVVGLHLKRSYVEHISWASPGSKKARASLGSMFLKGRFGTYACMALSNVPAYLQSPELVKCPKVDIQCAETHAA